LTTSKKFRKTASFFLFAALRKNAGGRKKFSNHQKLTHIDARLPGKNFRKIGPPHALEFKRKPERQILWNRQ
jgi:hypothetical protein